MKEEGRIFSIEDWDIAFGIEFTGISYCDGNYSWARSKSFVTVIEYIVEGTGTVIVDGVEYTASKGDIYILHKGTNHRYFCGWEKPWTKIFFNVYGSLCEKLLESYGLKDDVIISGAPLEDEFRLFYDIARDPDETDVNMFNKCAIQLHKIVQGMHAKKYHLAYEDSEAQVIKRLLDQNIFNPISIDFLSEKLFRSNDYIHKLFRKTYGITPYEYFITRRIEVAKLMLKNTSKSVNEISQQLCYSTPNYFSNQFRQRTSYTPTEYRKLH